jgi:hypothetical protein
VCAWVWSWSLDNEEVLARWGLLRHWGKRVLVFHAVIFKCCPSKRPDRAKYGGGKYSLVCNFSLVFGFYSSLFDNSRVKDTTVGVWSSRCWPFTTQAPTARYATHTHILTTVDFTVIPSDRQQCCVRFFPPAVLTSGAAVLQSWSRVDSPISPHWVSSCVQCASCGIFVPRKRNFIPVGWRQFMYSVLTCLCSVMLHRAVL